MFRKESLEIKPFSLISSCHTTSFMALLLILVVLVLLGQIVPRLLFGCSNEHGLSWQRLWPTRVSQRRLLFAKQSRRWLGQEIASLPSQVILFWR